MVNVTKKILSVTATLSVMMTTAFSTSAAAENIEDIEDSSYVLAGHYCYEDDGNYWTDIDGETYLVINLDEISDSQPTTASLVSTCSVLQDYPTSSWGNQTQRPVPHGSSYNGYANVSVSNAYSPVFKVYPVSNDDGADYRLTLDVPSGSSMNINVFTRMGDAGWSNTVYCCEFSFLTKTKKIFLGSNYLMTDAIAFEFLHDSSLSKITTFNYEFEAHLPLI